jgi:hypothetical protein
LNGEPAPNVPLTSDVRLLRDLAYPLITQPSEQGRIGEVLHEYGLNSPPQPGAFSRAAYVENLLGICRRSPVLAYSQLIDEVCNDLTRMPQFFAAAARTRQLGARVACPARRRLSLRAGAARRHLAEPDGGRGRARHQSVERAGRVLHAPPTAAVDA